MQPLLFSEKTLNIDKTWLDTILDSLSVKYDAGWTDSFGRAMRDWLTAQNHKPIKTLSLFSGGGGLDIGFHDSGFEIVEMVEVESKFTQTLLANTEPGKLLFGSKVIKKDIKKYEPNEDVSVDFIIGGPPCQSFSAAGRRAAGVQGTDDPRGGLFEEYVRILKKLQPRGFLFENVYGLVGAQNGDAWKLIQSELRGAGYEIFHRILDAADYGVPQHRERLIIIGLKKGEFLFPYPLCGPDSVGNHKFYSAGLAVSGIKTSDEIQGINGRYGNLLNGIPPGLNYSFYTMEMGHPTPIFGWRSKFSDFLYKADPEYPVRTIKAQGGQYTGPFSWDNRPFTLTELKRLQTFPDDYEIVGGRQVAIQQIGNSVPPQLSRILALSILNQIFGVELPFSMHYMPKEKELTFRKRKRELTARYAHKAKQAIEFLNSSSLLIEKLSSNIEETNVERFLTNNFGWSKTSSDNSIKFQLDFKLNNDRWEITCSSSEDKKTEDNFEITIIPSIGAIWSIPVKIVVLNGFDFNLNSFTALWKAFEEKLCQVFKVADLVQLTGYYQYKPLLSAELKFFDKDGLNSIWGTLKYVVSGVGVGKQFNKKEFKKFWNIDSDKEVMKELKTLRQIGYEVRSSNTNPQIPLNHFLIPYCFPTFSPQSVQSRKKFEKDND